MKLTASERAEEMYREGYAQALKEVGEWLEKNSISATTALISIDPDVVEALKRGEMPKEKK